MIFLLRDFSFLSIIKKKIMILHVVKKKKSTETSCLNKDQKCNLLLSMGKIKLGVRGREFAKGPEATEQIKHSSPPSALL